MGNFAENLNLDKRVLPQKMLQILLIDILCTEDAR